MQKGIVNNVSINGVTRVTHLDGTTEGNGKNSNKLNVLLNKQEQTILALNESSPVSYRSYLPPPWLPPLRELAMLYVDMVIPKNFAQRSVSRTYHIIHKMSSLVLWRSGNSQRQDRVINQTNNSNPDSSKEVLLHNTVSTEPARWHAVQRSFHNESLRSRQTYYTPKNAVAELRVNALRASLNGFRVLRFLVKRM